MGIVIFSIVVAAAILSIPIALACWYLLLLRVKDTARRRKIESRCSILTVILWVVIFFLPVDYGDPGSNYDIWFSVWLSKTLLVIWVPLIPLLFYTIWPNRGEGRERVTYLDLNEAVERQHSATELLAATERNDSRKRQIAKRITLVIAALFLVALHSLVFVDATSQLAPLVMITILMSGLMLLIWILIVRPIYLRRP